MEEMLHVESPSPLGLMPREASMPLLYEKDNPGLALCTETMEACTGVLDSLLIGVGDVRL